MIAIVGYREARVTFESGEAHVDGCDAEVVRAIDFTPGTIPWYVWPDLYARAGALIYRASLRPFLQDMARKDAALQQPQVSGPNGSKAPDCGSGDAGSSPAHLTLPLGVPIEHSPAADQRLADSVRKGPAKGCPPTREGAARMEEVHNHG